ncbi:MAG: hypothetical protein RIT27_277 [Pseudomonadota bacterium]|jgi:5-methylcytosine-specific restriction protein A
MKTYLLLWNPKKWEWETIQQDISELAQNGKLMGNWSCGRTKKIKPNDRFFLMRLGKEPKGICASGRIINSPVQDNHWDSKEGSTYYVDVEFETILDPNNESIFLIEKQEGIYKNYNWTPQSGGRTIPHEIAEQLYQDWSLFLEQKNKKEEITLPEEISEKEVYFEGAIKKISVNIYERNNKAREKCIEHYGINCYICEISFEKQYGEIGKGFIHVHHLKQLSEIREGYQVDPIEDLRPVCPNCHAMLHRKNPPYSIDELKEKLMKLFENKEEQLC